MKKPFIIIVSGAPATGKSTLAHLLSKEIKCPLLSRDEFKEGYINTIGATHKELDDSVALHIYESLFSAVDLLISKQISIIAEAAFQHKLWQPKLLSISDKAEIKVIVCKTGSALSKARYMKRLASDPAREIFHSDKSGEEQAVALIEKYQPLRMDLPTIEVDTTDGYRPGIEELIDFIKQADAK
jgi:adenylate kinase family enzyme